MANEFVLKVATPSTANANSYASGSWTPTANRPYLAAVVLSRGSSTDPVTPTLSGNNITWALTDATEGNNLFGSSGTIRHRLLLFKGVANGSPTTGATTVDCGGVSHTGCAIIISEGDANIDTTTFVVQTDKVAGTGLSAIDAALAAFADAANYTYACFGANEADVFTHEGTELADINYSNPSTTLMAQFLASADTTPGATFPGPDTLGVIAVEVALAAGGTTNEETGAAPADTTAAGADVFEATEAGSGAPDTVAAGADVFEATETAASPAGTVVSGTATKTAGGTEYPKDGAAVAGSTSAAADVFEATEAGATPAGTVSAATDVFEATEEGAGLADTLLAGVSEHTSGGGTTFNKTGAGVSASATSAADAFEATETGSTYAGTLYVGTDVFEAVETGAAMTAALMAGMEGDLVFVTAHFDQPTPSGGVDGGTPGAGHFDQPTPGMVLT